MTQHRELISAALQAEAAKHVENVRQEMIRAGLSGVLLASNVNICYTSLRFFRGYVWIPAQGEVLRFVIRPVGYTGSGVEYIRKPEQITERLAEHGVMLEGTIGLEYGELTYSDVSRLRKALGEVSTADCTMVLKRARMVKTSWEQDQMRRDGALQSESYALLPKLYREGMTDVELQIGLETELRRRGCLGRARVSGSLMEINLGSVLAGDNADVPSPYDFAMGGAGVDPSMPGGADGSQIKLHTTVMVDMNGCFNLYQSDMTRTWRVGDVGEQAMAAHECSRSILRALEKLGKPGEPVASLYNKAEEMAREAGLEKYFMGHSQKVSFIGHGVGIELNELPVVMARSKDVLAEGMTIALEPKFVIPGVGAVGVENTYIVTCRGLESITHFPEILEDLL